MAQQPDMNPSSIAEQTAANISPEFQEAFARVVQAGMKVMFSPETHDMMIQELEKDGDVAENIGNAVADLMMLLYQKSNGSMPSEVIVPAALYLMAKGSEFIESVTDQDLSPEIMSDAADVVIERIMGMAGVDPEKYRGTIDKAGGMMSGQGEAEDEGGEEPPEEETDPNEEVPEEDM